MDLWYIHMRGIATEAERNLPIVCPTGGGSETFPALAQNHPGAYSGVSLLLGSCFFFQEIVPEDMGVTRVSGGRARASRDADKVLFLLCSSILISHPASREPQPELAESPPCNSLSLIPACFLPRTSVFNYRRVIRVCDCFSAIQVAAQ